MPQVPLKIPQIGEGLQEARLVAVLKSPGDLIKRDEPIYQMETDKAVMDVESPYDGVLVKWLASVDDIIPIGADVATIETLDEQTEAPAHGSVPTAAPNAVPGTATEGARNAAIPPRTRAYAKEKGLSDDDLASISSVSGKLMPADVDAFLAKGTAQPRSTGEFAEAAMSPKQRLLSSRMVRGTQNVVPGTMSVAADWTAIDALREQIKASGDSFKPSAFTMFAYAAVRAIAEHPQFRTILINDNLLRTYSRVNLGIAVSLPGDELVIAAVANADTLSWRDFASAAKASIELARTGKDQASESVTISLTNMQSFGLRDAVPIVVAPAVATLFIGETYWGFAHAAAEPRPTLLCNLGLTFDHRIVNGVGAAEFLNAVKKYVQEIGSLIA